ncbi:unnamed protein product [Ectocarpus sp. 12 AP-2014]
MNFGKAFPMDNSHEVLWTNRSLQNAINIKIYLLAKFSPKEVLKFEELLKQFELTVSNFPTLYPASIAKTQLRRAVVHKHTTVYYVFSENKITVISMKDNRQKIPKK